MCGIAGFAGEGDDSDLAAMLHALHHRGPDAFGTLIRADAGIRLGHRRLTIIDADGGRQPMSNEDGRVHVTFNGEIYNHVELRAELEQLGHRFASDHSDTEVLVHGWEQWHEALPTRLNGMFAFAILDERNSVLFLARDRFGEKPLYWSARPRCFAFASELRALICHRAMPRAIDEMSLAKLFAYGFIPSPHSFIAGVHKLEPGAALTIRTSDLRITHTKWWEFRVEPSETDRTIEDLAAELRTHVERAVRRRLMSDVPIGVFLSGGIDSTVIVAAATAAMPGIETFSIGFDDPSFDESPWAALAARRFSTVHHVQQLDLDGARAALVDLLAQLDEPQGDPSILPMSLVARFARSRVKVALGGDGGDELFAGYDPFLALRPSVLLTGALPRGAIRLMARVFQHLPTSTRNMSLDFRIKRTLRGLAAPRELWNPTWLGPLDVEGITRLLGRKQDPQALYSEAIAIWNRPGSGDIIDRTLEFYTRLYLPDGILTKVDRASMLSSLEARAPLLDNDLVDFARQLPNRFKMKGGRTKVLLRSAFADVLPQSIVNRSKKGFGIPLTAWLRDWEDSSFLERADWADRDWLREKWQEHADGRADHRQLLWCTLAIDAFERATVPPGTNRRPFPAAAAAT